MKKLIGSLAVLALALSGLTFVAVSPALAASQCDDSETLTSSTSSAPGGTIVTLTDEVDDCNGQGQAGVQVTFSLKSGPCQVSFSSKTAITNAAGKATVTFVLPKNCPGQYVLSALANGVIAASTTTTVVETGGFPATAAESPDKRESGFSLESPMLLLAAGALMVAAAGGALYFRRRRS